MIVLRLLLLAAYLPLAYWAGVRHSPALAAVALGDLALVLLIEPLLRPRPWVWPLAAALALILAALARSGWTLPLLWLVPPACLLLVGGCFLRSLRPGRVPLIAKPVAAIYGLTPDTLPAAYAGYARRLSLGWALLLLALAALNLALALAAVPDGPLAYAGVDPPLAIPGARASLLAQAFTWGALIAFAIGEYALRSRVFPVRPYRNALDFARRMAALGPAFWRDFFR